MLVIFFFFKQKTAYEMRISDWSSDVCSSDLLGNRPGGGHAKHRRDADRRPGAIRRIEIPPPTDDERKELPLDQRLADPGECQRRSRTGRGAVGDRQSVV